MYVNIYVVSVCYVIVCKQLVFFTMLFLQEESSIQSLTLNDDTEELGMSLVYA